MRKHRIALLIAFMIGTAMLSGCTNPTNIRRVSNKEASELDNDLFNADGNKILSQPFGFRGTVSPPIGR
ncbi:MAG: hypothetical protein HYU64_11470 [Armatimonadetes bacterium]|nr:hypothetical protein [Armatimonadota bacterium]